MLLTLILASTPELPSTMPLIRHLPIVYSLIFNPLCVLGDSVVQSFPDLRHSPCDIVPRVWHSPLLGTPGRKVPLDGKCSYRTKIDRNLGNLALRSKLQPQHADSVCLAMFWRRPRWWENCHARARPLALNAS